MIAGAWIVSIAVRIWVPSTAPMFATVDAAMLGVVGYWFAQRSVRRDNGGST